MYEISRPELLNRIGSHIIAFNFIDSPDDMEKIIEAKIKDIATNFRDKFSSIGYRLNFAPNVIDYFIERHKGSIEKFGGRGLVDAIDYEVGHLLADQMLLAEKNSLKEITFTIALNEKGELKCRKES